MEALTWFGFNDLGHLGCNSVDAQAHFCDRTAAIGAYQCVMLPEFQAKGNY